MSNEHERSSVRIIELGREPRSPAEVFRNPPTFTGDEQVVRSSTPPAVSTPSKPPASEGAA